MPHARLDRNAHGRIADHRGAIGVVLREEQIHAGDRHDARGYALGGQSGLRLHGDGDFRASGEDRDPGRACGGSQLIGAARAQVFSGEALAGLGQVLAGEGQHAGRTLGLHGELPAFRRLGAVRRAEHEEIGEGAQAGKRFHGLMGRAILAQTDGVMGQHLNVAGAHEGGQPQGRTHVVGEDEEGGARGDQPPMQAHAVDGGGHTMLADAPMDEAARELARRDGGGGGDLRIIGAGEICGARHQLGQSGRDGGDDGFGGLAGGDFAGVLRGGALEREHGLAKGRRQVAREAALELSLVGIGLEGLLPRRMGVGATRTRRAPGVQNVLRDHEGLGGPAQRLAGAGDLRLAQRLAMGLGRARAGGGAIADGGLAADVAGLVGGLGALQRREDGVLIVPVDPLGEPAAGLETLHLIDGIGDRQGAVDGNVVVVMQHDHAGELEMARDGDGLLRDALHEIAVRGQHIGVMVHQIAKFGVQHALGQGHAHGGGDALPQRAGGGLDAGRVVHLGMAGGERAQLAEIADLLDGHALLAREIEEGVEQHGAVTGGEHETVPIRPERVGHVIFHDLGEEHGGDVGGAHGQPGMAGFGLFHRIHGKSANGVRHVLLGDAHRCGSIILRGQASQRPGSAV